MGNKRQTERSGRRIENKFGTSRGIFKTQKVYAGP